MGLFCKKQKTQEIINDFNYEEMMAAAKVTDFLSHAKVTFVNKKIDEYLPTEIETNMLGIYDKNDKLILVLSYDLDQKMLFKYMVNYYDNLHSINDVSFSLNLINPLFTIMEKNIENLPIDVTLCYLLLNQFIYNSIFNDFFDRCFFEYTLKNTLKDLNK